MKSAKRRRHVEDGLHARLRIQRDEARDALRMLMVALEQANTLLDIWSDEAGDDIAWFPKKGNLKPKGGE